MAMNDAWASAMTMAELSDQKIARLLKPRNREELLGYLALEDEINTSQTELPLGNNISSTTRSLQFSEVPSVRGIDRFLSKLTVNVPTTDFSICLNHNIIEHITKISFYHLIRCSRSTL